MKIHKVSAALPAAFVLIMTLLIAGCGGGDEPAPTDTRNILNLGNGTEPQDLDPHVVTGVTEHAIISALLEGLLTRDPETLAPAPGVAERWEVSEDGRQYVFHLRADARWSNGDPLTAADFIYGWQRALTPALGNQYAYMLYPVENAEAYHRGTLTDFSKVGVRAIDEHTLEVRLAHATPYFTDLLDHYSTFPLHRATIEKFGTIDTRGSAWTRAGNYVGNGPFILTRWEQNRIIEVERNPYYWDAAEVRLDGIHFHPIDQLLTEERMFRTGQLDITYTLPEEKVEVYRREEPEVLRIQPYFGTYFYNLNTTLAPLDDVRVRRALAMSIDREAIVTSITKGGQQPAYTLTPPDTRGYTARTAIPYDVEAARQLLAEAGYPDGQGFPQLSLLFNTLETHSKIATAIQQMWKQALNIDITLYNQDWKVYLDSLRTMDYQIARASWIGDYIDPNSFLELFISNGGNNRTGWQHAGYDQLLKDAARTPDQSARYELFQQAEQILAEEVPVIPIYTYARVYLISPRVRGWSSNLLDYHAYKYVSLEPVAND